METQNSNDELEEKKKELEEARKHYKRNNENDMGPYAGVEYKEEIRQLEREVDDLEEDQNS